MTGRNILEYEFFTTFLNTLRWDPESVLSVPYIDHFVPELKLMVGLEQSEDTHPEGDVFNHTIACIKIINILRNCGVIDESDSILLILCTTFHDIGKINTQSITVRDNGYRKISFLQHEYVGSNMIDEIFDRCVFLKFYKDDVKFVVENHMKMHALDKVRKNRPKIQALISSSLFLRILTPLNIADKHSRSATDYYIHNETITDSLYRQAIQLNTIFRDNNLDLTVPKKSKSVLNGHDLKHLGFKEGKEIGIILKDIQNIKYKLLAYFYIIIKYKLRRKK